MPGEREWDNRRKALTDGIPYPPTSSKNCDLQPSSPVIPRSADDMTKTYSLPVGS